MTEISDRRKEPRNLFTVTVKYAFAGSQTDNYHMDLGLTMDISDHGLGFYTNKAIGEGQGVTLWSKRLSETPVEAEVRWCSQVSEALYRVGLHFS
jgi:hypothetical protein